MAWKRWMRKVEKLFEKDQPRPRERAFIDAYFAECAGNAAAAYRIAFDYHGKHADSLAARFMARRRVKMEMESTRKELRDWMRLTKVIGE